MMKSLGIALIAALIAITFFVIGAEADRYFCEHPHLTVAPSVSNPDDAMVALHRCAKSASWNVTLKTHEPLTLELLTCPGDFHPKALGEPDDEGWPWSIRRQVLLLEQRGRWRVKVVSALYSDLVFTRVEPGSIEGSDTDAVLWSYSIKVRLLSRRTGRSPRLGQRHQRL